MVPAAAVLLATLLAVHAVAEAPVRLLATGVDNVGHRGASAVAPENTLPAFRRAFADGANAIECDLHLSADRVVVVIHDASIKRTTRPGPHTPPNVTETHVAALMWPYLATLDAGAWRGAPFVGTPLPRLEQVLEMLRQLPPHGGAPTFAMFDWKVPPDVADAVATVAHVLQRYPDVRARVLFGFWFEQQLRDAQRLMPDIRTMMISSVPLADWAKLRALNVQAVSLRESLVTPELIADAHAHRLRVYAWTVNDPCVMLRLLSFGTDGLLSDYPDIVSAVLRGEPFHC